MKRHVFLTALFFAAATAIDSLSYFTTTLEIPRDAPLSEARRAYRRLSLRYHPDKNPGDDSSHQRFIKIVEAYEGLIDLHSEMATKEDTQLMHHAQQGLNTIRAFQQQMDKTHSVPGLAGMRRTGRNKDTENHAALSLETFSKGDSLNFGREKKIICPHCGGKGGSASMAKCGGCGGSGLAMTATGGGGMTITGCGVCGGSGVLGRCPHCRGSGLVGVQKQYSINVEPGTPIGHKVLFVGDGDESPSAALPGDYVVELKEAKHNTFQRVGNDLYVVVRVPQSMPPPIDVTVTGLHGESLKLTHPGPITNGDQLTMTGKGMAYRQDGGELRYGNLVGVFYLT